MKICVDASLKHSVGPSNKIKYLLLVLSAWVPVSALMPLTLGAFSSVIRVVARSVAMAACLR
jgi:hypothetical protein